jgi:hypothetical protein
VAVIASETGGRQSDDFNVMTASDLPKPDVSVTRNADLPAKGTLALYALGPVRVNGRDVAQDDLILTDGTATVSGEWPVIAVRLFGL